ncbi:hypothetical protein GOP47_0002371 [Adiantum capillus-veneris]|uniref:RING-type domain-containing protein n=1 Tax=Adiantum capillus-veneris TaxID=13818 RepID=A0A9D4VAT3_ADICA|nr:hypothetical protein GOP47_0001976 [Adiantum capillus-veneris]KAI5082628.1 hypothetical protein GOP47_0002371 [Adiantum capillus-veneris]
MPQRHSKNNNDLAFFTYDEKRKLGYGTQRQRLGKESIKPFHACCICLKPFIDPLCCPKGHLFCKECILHCLLAQKKDIKRKIASFAAQQKQDQEEELERQALLKEQELEAFERQNNGADPLFTGKNAMADKGSGFHGANSVRVTSYEEEALRTMKAFWLPSATPEAPERVDAPSTDTVCPEGKEKLKLKDLFPVCFTELSKESGENFLDPNFMCPCCNTTFTNTLTLAALKICGHVFCKKCVDNFLLKDNACTVCSRPCKLKHVVTLEKGGTGFAGHDEGLQASVFKHVGSGSGMGLTRPVIRT